jgi:hypothetical protein
VLLLGGTSVAADAIADALRFRNGIGNAFAIVRGGIGDDA